MKLYRIDYATAAKYALIYRRTPDTPAHTHDPREIFQQLLNSKSVILVEPCEHGKYDGHWPKRKCHCGTNEDGEKGGWSTSFMHPTERIWRRCTHEPWCDGAGLEAK